MKVLSRREVITQNHHIWAGVTAIYMEKITQHHHFLGMRVINRTDSRISSRKPSRLVGPACWADVERGAGGIRPLGLTPTCWFCVITSLGVVYFSLFSRMVGFCDRSMEIPPGGSWPRFLFTWHRLASMF